VLDDDTYWFLYSAVGEPLVVAGAFHGNSSTQQGILTSSNGRDFNLDGNSQLDATVAANVVLRESLRGTLTYSNGGRSTFTTTFYPGYDEVPDLAKVAGTYTGWLTINAVLVISYTVTVSPSGAFVMIDPAVGGAGPFTSAGLKLGCGYIGTVSPRAQGNVYDIAFTHASTGCGAETFAGVAFLDAATSRLYILAMDGDRNAVFPFLGTKQ
jgi:hypothetical protein